MTAPGAPAVPGPGENDSKPIPDPTVLTTQLVDRAIASFRELMDARFASIDTASELLATSVGKDIEAARSLITAILDERLVGVAAQFAFVATQFAERDERTKEAAVTNLRSLDAALAAAKEAVQEQQKANAAAIQVAGANTQKQIDAIVALLTASIDSLRRELADMKGRLDRGEGVSRGTVEAKTEGRLNVGQVMVGMSVLIGIVAIIVTIVLSRGM